MSSSTDVNEAFEKWYEEKGKSLTRYFAETDEQYTKRIANHAYIEGYFDGVHDTREK